MAETTDGGFVDYAAQLQLNMSSATAKTSATVRTHVDGDTVHFDVPESVCADGVLKARFLALNTPESTGKIEEYGVAASHFTQEKLASAVSIILESDSDRWELDSTGGRMLVWVWYQPSEGAEYRNLNLELLQNGYARAYSTANNQYGSICSSALDQARQFKLNLYSGQPDPDFYYGDAIELTLRELRCHPEAYQNKKVAFNGRWSHMEALDEDEWLEHLEEHLKEIVNISGKDEKTLAMQFEAHRREVYERIAKEHPELAKRFQERRHKLDEHLKQRRPEVYELVVRLREENQL